MSTLAVAKKDFQDGIRSRSLLALVVLFALFVAGATYYITEISSLGPGTSSGDLLALFVIGSLVGPTQLLLPLIATLVGYKSISGERESGSLKFLLGLPHTRWDVVVGKLLGRSGIITVAVLIGYAVGGIALYALIDAFPLADYAILLGMSVLLGVVFVSIAIAFSSAVQSSTVATSGAIVLVLLFTFLWNVVLILANYAAEVLSLPASSPSQPANWYLFLTTLNPTQAFHSATNALLGVGGIAAFVQTPNPPFYLENWFGFVILGVWLVVPIGLAYLRFERADL